MYRRAETWAHSIVHMNTQMSLHVFTKYTNCQEYLLRMGNVFAEECLGKTEASLLG